MESRKALHAPQSWSERKVILYAGRIFLVVAILLIWQALTQPGLLNPAKYGRPSGIFLSFQQLFLSGELWTNLGVTLYEEVLGFVIGVGSGTAIGLGLWWSLRLSKILEPFAVIYNGIPKIALAPPMIVWFGIFETSKIMLAATITFVIAWLSAYEGVRQVDIDQIDMMRGMGANRLQTFMHVVVPSSLPWVITSLKINIGFALAGAIVGEFVTSNHGLGYLAVQATIQFQMNRLWVLVFIIMLVAVAQYWIVLWSERRLLGWTGETRV